MLVKVATGLFHWHRGNQCQWGNADEIQRYQTTTKQNNTPNVCIILGMISSDLSVVKQCPKHRSYNGGQMHCQYHRRWSPGDARNRNISSYGIFVLLCFPCYFWTSTNDWQPISATLQTTRRSGWTRLPVDSPKKWSIMHNFDVPLLPA